MCRDSEPDVVGAILGEAHGVVTRAADVDADDVARAEDLACVHVAGSDVFAPREVHTVGAQRAGELRIALDQRGNVLLLRQLHERPCLGRGQPTTLACSDQQRRGSGRIEVRGNLLRIGTRHSAHIQLRLNLMPHRHVPHVR